MPDWDGAEYRRVNSLQQWLADRALDGLPLDGVRSVLDIGCGDGRITAEIAARDPDADVLGIDPSPRMISVAPVGGRLRFELGDVLSLDYTDRFDLVVSFNALHWVRDQRRALDRIATALRPSGRALLVFVCAGPRPSLEDVAMDVAATPRWADSFRDVVAPYVHPDVAEWSASATAAGLAVDATDVADLSWDFGSRAAFTRWCTVGFGAWTDHLPAGAATGFVDDVVAAYERVTTEPGVFRFMQLRADLQRPPT
jgi:trans-aconitate 2-methyltransferase